MKKIFLIIFILSTLLCNAQKLIVNGYKHAAPAITYSTFNPSFTEPGLILSNGNKTLTGDGLTNGLSRSIDSCWQNTAVEITVTNASAFAYFGLVTKDASRGDAPGVDQYGWIWRGDGFYGVTNFDFGSATFQSLSNGDIVGMTFNISNGEQKMYKNGTLVGTMFTLSTSSKYYVAAGFRGTTDALTVNFGATAFSYSYPYTGLYH